MIMCHMIQKLYESILFNMWVCVFHQFLFAVSDWQAQINTLTCPLIPSTTACCSNNMGLSQISKSKETNLMTIAFV